MLAFMSRDTAKVAKARLALADWGLACHAVAASIPFYHCLAGRTLLPRLLLYQILKHLVGNLISFGGEL